MAIKFDFGGGSDNEYQSQAESAMLEAKRKDKQALAAGMGASGSIIAQVADLLGINHQVAKPPKQGKSSDTGDLASTPAGPDSEKIAVMDKKGSVVDTVQKTIQEVDPAVKVQPLAMAPLTLSNDGLPRAIQLIDPNTGRPFGQ